MAFAYDVERRTELRPGEGVTGLDKVQYAVSGPSSLR